MSETLESIPIIDPSEEAKHDRALRRELNLGKFKQDDYFQKSRNHQPDESARRLPIRDAQLPARDSRRALIINDKFADPVGLAVSRPLGSSAVDNTSSKKQNNAEYEPYSPELPNDDHYLPEEVDGSWAFGPNDQDIVRLHKESAPHH